MAAESAGKTVGHRWRPIEDLPEDWECLADNDLQRLSEYWDENREELVVHGAVQDFNERLKREWAIETGLIERIYTLDRGTTEVLLERGLRENLIPASATNRDPALVIDILHDHAEALDGLFDFVKGDRELSTSFVKEIHSVLLAHQDTASARNTFGRRVEMPLQKGDYKKRPNSPVRPDGLVHEYCPPEQVASEMERLIEMHMRHRQWQVPPEIEAAWLHHRFVQIHPFQDGNGRVARALATLVMIRGGLLTLVVTDAMRDDYIGALEAADAGDLEPLVSLFADIQRRAIYGAIGKVQNVIAEKRHLKAVVQAVADKFNTRDRKSQEDWEPAKEIGRVLAGEGARHLERAATALKGALAGRGKFWVTSSADDDPERRSYYGYQVAQTARAMDYYANTREFHSWAALNLVTASRHELLVSVHVMGHEFGGLLVASACLATREQSSDASGTFVSQVEPVTKRLFQISYKEEPGDARVRFDRWIGDAVVQGLARWQELI